MQYGSNESRNIFPHVLQLPNLKINSSMQAIFNEEVIIIKFIFLYFFFNKTFLFLLF